jgi:hypothetical protein
VNVPTKTSTDRVDDEAGTDSIDRLVSSSEPSPVLIEQFRNLAASLNRTQRERSIKSLLVTSPAPGDGKSHVAVHLALTLSDSYRRKVLLIDADMRRPTLHHLFHVAGMPGLHDALRAEGSGLPDVLPITSTLSLLPVPTNALRSGLPLTSAQLSVWGGGGVGVGVGFWVGLGVGRAVGVGVGVGGPSVGVAVGDVDGAVGQRCGASERTAPRTPPSRPRGRCRPRCPAPSPPRPRHRDR